MLLLLRIILSFTTVECKHSLMDSVQKTASVTNQIKCWIFTQIDEEPDMFLKLYPANKQFPVNPMGYGHIPNA